MTRRRAVESLAVIAAFAVLVAAMTWPQALHLSSHAPPHQDIYFNMWRLAWFAHALATSPSRLFDANIFHPEPRTLALSDAMIVEGARRRAAVVGRPEPGPRPQPHAAWRDRAVRRGDVRARRGT